MATETTIFTTLLPDGRSYYAYADLPSEMCMTEEEFKTLWSEHPLEYGKVMNHGKVHDTPRWQKSYGLGYYFSGLMHEADPISNDYVKRLLAYVNELTLEKGMFSQKQIDAGAVYNQVLVNWYKDGDHCIGKHSDDEGQLHENTPIYTVSFGQTRDFVVESKKNKKGNEVYRKVIPVKNNTLLIMGGEMQKHYYHSVPRRTTKKVKSPRISITFRCFKHQEVGSKRKRNN